MIVSSRRGDRLVVGVELTDARSVSQLWGDRYDISIDDILTVESDIAQRITEALSIELSSADAERLDKRYTEVPSAHMAYMEARHAWSTRTREGLSRALELNDRAIAADPSFALAHASKAETYLLMMLYMHRPSDHAASLQEEVATAIRLDPDLAEAWPVQGFVHTVLDWDWPSAERAFKKAIELNPKYPTAHHWYAVYLRLSGDPVGDLREVEEARRLDRGSLIIAVDYALALAQLGRVAEAEATLVELRETAPATRDPAPTEARPYRRR